MLENKSITAGEEAWEGQMANEDAAVCPGQVKSLKDILMNNSITCIDVKEFSNATIAKVFHYIIKVCSDDMPKHFK